MSPTELLHPETYQPTQIDEQLSIATDADFIKKVALSAGIQEENITPAIVKLINAITIFMEENPQQANLLEDIILAVQEHLKNYKNPSSAPHQNSEKLPKASGNDRLSNSQNEGSAKLLSANSDKQLTDLENIFLADEKELEKLENYLQPLLTSEHQLDIYRGNPELFALMLMLNPNYEKQKKLILDTSTKVSYALKRRKSRPPILNEIKIKNGYKSKPLSEVLAKAIQAEVNFPIEAILGVVKLVVDGGHFSIPLAKIEQTKVEIQAIISSQLALPGNYLANFVKIEIEQDRRALSISRNQENQETPPLELAIRLSNFLKKLNFL